MVHRRLVLWLMLIVGVFNSTIGLPMHEVMHAEGGHIELSASIASDTPANVHTGFEDTDACASCHAYVQLSLAFISPRLGSPSHENVAFAGTIPRRGLFSSLWSAYSSGCDPPAEIV